MTMTIRRLTSDQVQGNVSRDHSLVERINALVDMIYDEYFVEDMTVYISPTGDDEAGKGTALEPWATFDRALRDIPNANVLTIRPAAGTYTSFPEHLSLPRRGGTVVIDASHNAYPRVAGPYVLAAATGLSPQNPTYGAKIGYDYSVAGVSWGADAHYGRYIHWLTGPATGYIYPIYSNTATALRSYTDWYGVAPGHTFEIVTEPVTIAVDHVVHLKCDSARAQKGYEHTSRPHLAIAGVRFGARGQNLYAFVMDNIRLILSFAALVNRAPTTNGAVQVTDSNINNLDPYASGLLPFVKPALNDWFAFGAHVLVRNGAVAPAVGRFIELRSSWVATLAARGAIAMVDGYSHLGFTLSANVTDDGHAAVVEFLYIDQATLSGIVAIDIHDSTMYLSSAYVRTWNTPFIVLRTGGLRAEWVRESNGSATHAITVYRGGRFALLTTNAISATGSVNAIKWGTTNGSSNWPIPFSGVTDGAGSWVTKENA